MARFEKIGEFNKTRRADMLTGFIEIKELNLKIRVLAFIKTKEQKKKRTDPDMVILLPNENGAEVEIPENIFE